MNYDELVKSLRTDHYKYFARDMEAADAITELSRRCEQFQYMPTPAWISVKERLPGDETVGVRVLCYLKNEKKHAEWIDDRLFFDGGFWHPKGQKGVVTHWMPLPEPPKEETE